MTNRKGHILILVENLPVPFDRRVWMEALTLTAAGYKVSVISPCPPEDAEEPDKVIEGVSVYRYPPPPQTKGKLSFVREFAYCLWHTDRLTKRIWDSDRFDVIQSCNPPDTFWWIARKYKGRGVKFVFDHHDLCPELYESKFGRRDILWRILLWMERKQFSTADAVISTNGSYKEIAISRGGKSPEKVAVVRSGPKLELFQRVAAEPNLKRGRTYMGIYLGVMAPQDGVDYALRAIRHALDLGLKDTCFTFVGSGDASQSLKQLAEELNLLADGTVLFTGRLPDLELRSYLSTSDFGLAPDPKNPLNDCSTMNKIVEYMAFGLPIVSFDLKESRYSAGEAAIYVADNDECEFGRAIISLLSDEARRSVMSSFAMARVTDGLGWDHSSKVLVEFYDRILLGSVPHRNADVYVCDRLSTSS